MDLMKSSITRYPGLSSGGRILKDTAHQLVFSIRENIAWREVDNKVAIVAPLSQELIILNHTGSWLWQQIANAPASGTDLCRSLMEHFSIDESQARSDVDGFLAELREKDLINEVTP